MGIMSLLIRWSFFFFFFVHHSFALNIDGVLLLSFKFSITTDPLGVLSNWNSTDINPCSWNGVTCGGDPAIPNPNASFLVTSLSLPNSQLLGSMPANLGMISHLRVLNLSNNSINGTIPLSIFMASQLRTLDISGNSLTGELPDLVGGLSNLEILNLSDNFLGGKIPENLTSLSNLTVISLKNNYFYGSVPRGVNWIRLLDLSMNLINGSLPWDFQGNHLTYFNVSFNRISGEISSGFANQIPTNATIDLSFNHLVGEIPATSLFFNQDPRSFYGNNQLCGQPLRNLCPVTSSLYTPPNGSPPAIAAIPKTFDSSAATDSTKNRGAAGEKGRKSRVRTIIVIVVGDLLGIAILAFIILYVYRWKKKKKKKKMGSVSSTKSVKPKEHKPKNIVKITHDWSSTTSSDEVKGIRALACLRKQTKEDDDEDDDDDNSSAASTTSGGFEGPKAAAAPPQQKGGELVTVDGERELELETLLKASAYILGASGSSITYKAVLEDGTSLAVRRIGESGLERFKDFENQVRAIAKLVHPNLVRIRGFYWGTDEKLVIYDFISNGSLANSRHRKVGSSPCHLQWEMRLKIAKGVARGLAYIHDKKHVHGNLKPSNILLGTDMEPRIGDFGLERLVTGENSYRPSGSSRIFGSKRSTASRESFHELQSGGPTPSPSPSSMGGISPYYAPESLRSLKPHQKWDVYSFGVVLLELIMGKISSNAEELAMVLAGEESGGRVLRMADAAIRGEVEGKEDALVAIMRLGLSCISPVPQKRPAMKEVVHALDKFPSLPLICYSHQ